MDGLTKMTPRGTKTDDDLADEALEMLAAKRAPEWKRTQSKEPNYRLTDAAIREALAKGTGVYEPGHARAGQVRQQLQLKDGGGLFLRIGPTGKASWLFTYTLKDKPHTLGLGSHRPDESDSVSLAQARVMAAEYRTIVAQENRHPRPTMFEAKARLGGGPGRMPSEPGIFQELKDALAVWQNILHHLDPMQALGAKISILISNAEIPTLELALDAATAAAVRKMLEGGT